MRGVLRFLLRTAVRSAKLLLALGVLLAAAGLVFGIGAWLSVERDFRSAEVDVPDLAGLTVEEATVASAKAGLALSVTARRPHDVTPPGLVFFQDPLAGSKSRRSRQVKVVVSTGSSRSLVPDLTGLSPRKAVVVLGEAKLRLGEQVQVHSDRQEANTILAQDPPADTEPRGTDVVDIVVSLGPRGRAWVMPDLRGLTRQRVESFLASFGVRVGEVREQAVPNLAAGIIHGQFPPPGSRLTAETAVSLVVSRPLESGASATPPPVRRVE